MRKPLEIKGKTCYNMIINTSVKPSYFDDGYTYMELIGMLTQKVIECINSCNLSDENVKKIIDDWKKLIQATDDGKNLIEELTALFNDKDVGFTSTQDIIDMFNAQPSTSYELATNPDIDNIF